MCQTCAHRLLGHLAAALTAAVATVPDTAPAGERQHHADLARAVTLFVPPGEGDPKPSAEACADFFAEIGASRTRDIDNALGYITDMANFISQGCGAVINALAAVGDAEAKRVIEDQESTSLIKVNVISLDDLTRARRSGIGPDDDRPMRPRGADVPGPH